MQIDTAHIQKHNSIWRCIITIIFALAFTVKNVSANSSPSNDVSNNAVLESQASNVIGSSGNFSKLPSISAVLKKYNERNPDILVTNWIQMSPAGMRIIDVESKAEIIKNFVDNRVWLTNKKNKTIHEIDIAFYQKHFPKQVQYLVGPESISNIAGMKPCADLIGKNSGKRVWRGQIVEVWDCQYEEGELANTQFFSNRWNIVVQVKHTDSRIEELIDIKEERLTEASFVPDSVLKNVELTEFMTGRALLDSYSP